MLGRDWIHSRCIWFGHRVSVMVWVSQIGLSLSLRLKSKQKYMWMSGPCKNICLANNNWTAKVGSVSSGDQFANLEYGPATKDWSNSRSPVIWRTKYLSFGKCKRETIFHNTLWPAFCSIRMNKAWWKSGMEGENSPFPRGFKDSIDCNLQ